MSDNRYSTRPPTPLEAKEILKQVDEILLLGAGSLAHLGISDSMPLWLESLAEAQVMLLRRPKGKCSDHEVAECAARVIASMFQVAVAVGFERFLGEMLNQVDILQRRARGLKL